MNMILMLLLWLVCCIAAVIGLVWMLVATLVGSRRSWTLAKSFDQLINAATGGSEDETISSRAGRAEQKGKRWACVLCRLLDILDKDHCKNNIEKGN